MNIPISGQIQIKIISIEKKETDNLSKLDLKNMISEILDEYSRNSEHIDICGN